MCRHSSSGHSSMGSGVQNELVGIDGIDWVLIA